MRIFCICALSWVFTLCLYFHISFRGVSVTVAGMCFCVMVCQCMSWPSPRRRLPEVLGVGTGPDRRHTARRSDWEQTCPHLPRELYKPSKSPCLASPPQASQGGWLERGHEETKTTSAHLPHLVALEPGNGGPVPWTCPPRAPSTLCGGSWTGARDMARVGACG